MNFTPVRSIPSTLNNIAGRLRTARPPNKKQRRHENRQRASKRSHIAPPIAVRTRFVHVSPKAKIPSNYLQDSNKRSKNTKIKKLFRTRFYIFSKIIGCLDSNPSDGDETFWEWTCFGRVLHENVSCLRVRRPRASRGVQRMGT